VNNIKRGEGFKLSITWNPSIRLIVLFKEYKSGKSEEDNTRKTKLQSGKNNTTGTQE
jgi:hypothetical protein